MLKRILFGTSILVALILSFLALKHYVNVPDEEYRELKVELPTHYSGKKFAGSQSCIPCHNDIYKSHISTAHYKTSAPASSENILGSFHGKENHINLAGSLFRMTQDDEGSYQTSETYHGKVLKKSKIDIIIGSGVKGQSYLTFKGDSLYQLQASYFTLTNNWINSPGFPNYSFERPVKDNCIKCHVTFARNEEFSGNANVYDRNSFIYGVDCERCHGPSQEHVNYRTGITNSLNSDPIVRSESLSRKQQMDACAQCHAGLRNNQIKENPFSYIIGDNLEEYSKNYNSNKANPNLDVHGNQYGLLISSQCFKESQDMTCITCHNPHKNQRGTTQYFNDKCISCHNQAEDLHIVDNTSKQLDYSNCIECHMPQSPSNIMKVKSTKDGAENAVNVRSHLIAVYVESILEK